MTTSVKTCFKCGEPKELSRFYKHPQMADGHLNKCKPCTRQDAASRRRNPKFREKVLAYDRARGNRQSKEYHATMKQRFPEKDRARRLVGNAVRDGRLNKPDRCSHCHSNKSRVVGHHPDYDKPLEVVWLCDVCHQQLHALLDTVENKIVEGRPGNSKPDQDEAA